MHLVLYFPANYSDIELAQRLKENNIEVFPISSYSLDKSHKMGLVLGYGGVDDNAITANVVRLVEIIKAYPSWI